MSIPEVMLPLAQVPSIGETLPAIELPTNCPNCGIGIGVDDLRVHAYVCECGHHFPMRGDSWISLLADPGTWQERWADIRPHDLLVWVQPKPYRTTLQKAGDEGLNEAVRTGTCRLAGREISVGVFDFRFVGGTLGIVAGERLTRAIELAITSRMPFVLVAASGGARMQEGILALMQMAKVNGAVSRIHAAGLPFVSILTDPTFGGTAASLALLADVNIAEPEASIGFTGPRVIKQATYADLPKEFQKAEFQLHHGQVDMVAPRTELRARLAHLLDLYSRCSRFAK
jgi:acetyl-CoA carboxylase carboxyl transferase subunit beta